MAIGDDSVSTDKIQVHPNGLIDPKVPGSKGQFLAAEAFLGEGGLLLNADGDRFCDELGDTSRLKQHRPDAFGLATINTLTPLVMVIRKRGSLWNDSSTV